MVMVLERQHKACGMLSLMKHLVIKERWGSVGDFSLLVSLLWIHFSTLSLLILWEKKSFWNFPSSLESTPGFSPVSINHTLISPVLIHPVFWVALPPSVPSTHHSHHLSPPYSFIPGLKRSFWLFVQIFFTVAFIFFFRTDSTDFPDCLPIPQSIFVFICSFFPLFSCWFHVAD